MDAIVAAVAERAERGVDVVKVMASGGLLTPGTDLAACNFTDAELRLMVDEAHRHGLPIVAHAHALPAVEQSANAGVDGIQAGVRLLSGSDAGGSLAKPHGVLRESVIDLIVVGVPCDEALASATGHAADAVGLGDRTGRLRPGLGADLLIVDGDPLTDPTALRDVRTVVARGQVTVTA